MISIKNIIFILILLNYACISEEPNCEEKLKSYLLEDFRNYYSNELTIYYLPEYGCISCAMDSFNEIIKNSSNDSIFIIFNRNVENNFKNVIIFKDHNKKYLRLNCLGNRHAKIVLRNKNSISINYLSD
jgi:hypothetical protein